ncbi:uncharacterized protein N7518_007768 [Penicillium psychrosexuale]|uniref:uncharacterized protein n=1 Tax=Penicillium psychrosexuale TaxID=1002107 RepID=UPI002544F339|nr:uncharacterized protein N7518_007768 [Penicillium psychrosexuale]KAJ5790757.1 hypothetical protein N7518_007768 [Penicillium psychrosexuale]
MHKVIRTTIIHPKPSFRVQVDLKVGQSKRSHIPTIVGKYGLPSMSEGSPTVFNKNTPPQASPKTNLPDW